MRYPLPRCFAALILCAGALPAQGPLPNYTILYTGGLQGYARMPDSQVLNGPTNGPHSAVADDYLALLQQQRDVAKGRPVVVLGMGDNFAPDLFARTFAYLPAPHSDETKCLPPESDTAPGRVPKDWMYFNDAHRWVCWEKAGGHQEITFDNVAQFFIQARYLALVPGKHDFYFGPERLQHLADLLQSNGIAMLAANLIQTTSRAPTFANAYPRIPEVYAHHRFNTDFGPTSVDLPDPVLPWKRDFKVKGARQYGVTPLIDERNSYICWEPGEDNGAGRQTNSDPWSIPLPTDPNANCAKLVLKPPAPEPRAPAKAPEPPSNDVTFVFADREHRDQDLHAGFNHMFCTHLVNPRPPRKSVPDQWTCQTFSVQKPFFNGRFPYQMSDDKRVAVFGVVDPDLLKNVGMLNTSWRNRTPAYDTVTAVAPVDYTLKQVLERCDADDTCHKASKILMAQMSPARASALIGAFRKQFDIVISEADADHRTGNITLSENETAYAAPSGVPDKFYPQFVLTPPDTIRTSEDKKEVDFVPQVSRADVIRPMQDNGTGTWALKNRICAAPNRPVKTEACTGSACNSLQVLSATALASLRIVSPAESIPRPEISQPAPSSSFQDLVLTAMRDNRKTDMAFLQQRDFFNADNFSQERISPYELQNQIDRIVWKGDFVTTLHVTGATLKKLYKQSQKFDELDKDSLSMENEKGRGLVTLGLFKDPRDTDAFYVNGVQMDDTALYSVAATDYLAAGDTGYADLATPDVPPPLRMEDFPRVRTITGLVCETIRVHNQFGTPPCNTDLLKEAYFDKSDMRPFDKTPGFDTGAHYTTILARTRHHPDMPNFGAEHNVQQRPYWSLNLENMDFAFSGTMVNHVSTAGSTFAGVSATGVTSTGSTSYGSDHKLRLIYDFGPGTFYLMSDSAFLRTTVTGSTPPSLAQNVLGWEAGGTLRFLSTSQRHLLRPRPFWLSTHYSVRYEGQLIEPAPSQATYASSTVAAPQSLNLETPKSGTLYGRLGLRLEHADTYFETGVEEGDFRNVLTQYVFQPQQLYCQPSASMQFACGSIPALNSPADSLPIATVSQLFGQNIRPSAVLQSSFLDPGFYLNFNMKFPIWSRRDKAGADKSYYFILANKGDWFFNSRADTTVQTHYLDKLSPAFSLPIYGKLTLTPRVDIILYENKVNQNHFRAVEPSVSLSYSFKWRPGMDLGRAAGYGAIATTPPVSIPPP